MSAAASVWLEKVEGRRSRRPDGVENERRDHGEIAATSAAQRPEELTIVVIIVLDDATVSQNYL